MTIQLLLLSGKDQEIQIEHCQSNLCHEDDVTYDVPMGQLQSLMKSSGICTQTITLKCLLAPAKVSVQWQLLVSERMWSYYMGLKKCLKSHSITM